MITFCTCRQWNIVSLSWIPIGETLNGDQSIYKVYCRDQDDDDRSEHPHENGAAFLIQLQRMIEVMTKPENLNDLKSEPAKISLTGIIVMSFVWSFDRTPECLLLQIEKKENHQS